MAIRRMFSKRVIESARFLKMPLTTQALYFHLGMRADDDGVVEAYSVVKMVGASEDDLKVLVSKGLVQVLNEDLVTYITDWTENNQIRPDRKIDSIYKDLLLRMNPEVTLIEKRPRTDVVKKSAEADGVPTGIPMVYQVSDDGQPMDNQWTSNGQPMDGIGKDRVGKDRIGKVSSDKDSKDSMRFTPPTLEEVDNYIFKEGYSVDAEQFVSYYESQKWKKANGRPLSDWQAAVRYWERSRKEKEKKSFADEANAAADRWLERRLHDTK